MGNNGKRRRKRVALTAQLVPGQDDDLIQWLTGIEAGNRAGAIKKAIRSGLGFDQPGQDQPESEVVTFDDLDRVLKELDKWAGEVTDHLRADMIRMVNDLLATGQINHVPAALEDNTTITDERKKKRDKRIKAAQW